MCRMMVSLCVRVRVCVEPTTEVWLSELMLGMCVYAIKMQTLVQKCPGKDNLIEYCIQQLSLILY